MGYEKDFLQGDTRTGAYQCRLTLADPSGFTLTAGGPRTAFVAPAAREYAPSATAALGGPAQEPKLAAALPTPAAQWAADRATALAPTRIAALYAAYQASKKDPAQVRPLANWWGLPGQRGGVRHTLAGSLGEYQADKLFHAQGHEKLNNGGQLCGLLDPPQGPGLDGVWRNASPPPAYLLTETKVTTAPGKKPKLSTGQMSDQWVLRGNRLERALDNKEELSRIREAIKNNDFEKRLLHINSDGVLTQYAINKAGKISLL